MAKSELQEGTTDEEASKAIHLCCQSSRDRTLGQSNPCPNPSRIWTETLRSWKYVRYSQEISNCTQYNPPAQCFPVQTAFPPLSGNTEYTRSMQQQQIAGNRDQKNSKTLHSGHTEKFTQGTIEKKRGTRVGAEPVCSQHSASQDTLRDCTKCRGILAYVRFKALSRTESDEASSRSCCAQLTI